MAIVSSIFEIARSHSTAKSAVKLFVALTAFYVFKYRGNAIGTRRRRDLIEPKGALPLIGHLYIIASTPGSRLFHLFEKYYNTLGPVWAITIPGLGRMIEIDTPENIEHVLKTNFWSYEKGPMLYEMMGDLVGKPFFIMDGDDWKTPRKVASQIINMKAFQDYAGEVFITETKRVVEYLGKAADNGTIIDIQAMLHHLTFSIMLRISFGDSAPEISLDRVTDYEEAFDKLLERSAERLMNPLAKLQEKITGSDKTYKKYRESVRNYGLEIIRKRREAGYTKEKNDLLQYMLEAKDDSGNSLTEDRMIDMIFALSLAGRDTTAQALTWTFALIYHGATDKEIAKKLREEADEIFKGSDPTYEQLKQMKYTEACFLEGLRFYPGAPRNLKTCIKDDVLPDGTKVYAKEWVSWSAYVMGRSESLWGPDAKEYKPTRWIGTPRPSAAKFNAFSLGPRVCIGQQFAMLIATISMGMLHQSFDIELEEPFLERKYVSSLTIPMDGPLRARFRRRHENASDPEKPYDL
ncbi:hypothetical protein BGZ76_002387 [Entomortierella beljakovae]|nr:hypothetical protein BGZ76_002387 [Entomortierella beljakovae]